MAERLRVFSFSAAGELGGAERSWVELLRALPAERLEVYAGAPPATRLFELCAASGLAVRPLPAQRWKMTLRLGRLFAQMRTLNAQARGLSQQGADLRIDLLHANTDAAALLAWRANRFSGIPWVWHCRDLRRPRGVARFLSRSAAAVVAISAAVERQLLAEGVLPEKVRRVENGLDLSVFHALERRAEVRARARATLDLEADQPVILSIGALVPWKQHEIFLQLLADLRQTLPAVTGLLAGSDLFGQNLRYAQSVRRLAAELNLAPPTLRLLGQRDDVPDLLAASDVLVSCSEKEPFGRTLVEAGAAGLPVVATNSGAKAEIVANGVTGLLVPPGNPEALQAACLKILADTGLRARMGASAVERVTQLFDVRRTAAEITRIFEVLHKPAGCSPAT